jgi:cytochrome c-type biogenesis protein CcmH
VTVASATAPAQPGPARSAARRWGAWVALVVVVAVAGVIGLQPASHPTLDQRAVAIGNRVRCPVCEGQTVNQSDTPPSQAIKADIQSELAAGESSQQVLDGIVRSYGTGILEQPPASGVNLLVWIIPVLAVAAAAVALGLAFRRWRPTRRPAGAGPAVSADDRRLVDDALGSATPGAPASEPPSEPGEGAG